jgi:phosphopantetheine adenylyltransferase
MNNNPLRQFFRRPSIYLKLPSGGTYYSPDVIDMPENGELPVYPMTAIDDITTKTPDALFNGQALVDIMKSCIPAIKQPWMINSIDLDAIMIAIRSASSNDGMDISSTCPKCAEESEYKINLGGLLTGLKSADYSQVLDLADLKIKFKPLTYKEMNEVSLAQFEMQRAFGNINAIEDIDEKIKRSKEALAAVTEVSMKALAKTISSITVPSGEEVTQIEFIHDFLQNCSKSTYEAIRDSNTKMREESGIKPLKIKCIHCQYDYDQTLTLNVTDFFA